MELEEILKIIKEDFPDKSIDISESLGLLMDTSFENNKNMNGKKNKYFSIDEKKLQKPEKVAEKIYIETQLET